MSFEREPVPSLQRAYPHVLREVRRYCDSIAEQLDAGRGIWFTGDVGTGKTTLAMLISKTAMEADRTVAIYSLPRLLAMLRETFRDDAQYSLSQLIDKLCSVDLLHIDDVGAEQTTPWVLEQLYTVVNTRYEDRRSLILTTNLIEEAARGGPRTSPRTSGTTAPTRSCASRSATGRCRGCTRCAATRCRCSATTGASRPTRTCPSRCRPRQPTPTRSTTRAGRTTPAATGAATGP